MGENLLNFRADGLKILNGMSLGIVIALVPSAILGNLATALHWTLISPMLTFATTLMCLMMGIVIGLQFKFDPIGVGTLGVTTMLAGGSFKGLNPQGVVQLAGSGDVINAAIAAILSIVIIRLLAGIKSYRLLVIPGLSIVVIGLITHFTAAPVGEITTVLGLIIKNFIHLQPVLMSLLIGISFAFLIVSPVSSVAVALLINLSGNGSAAANIGITGLAFTLAILSYPKNGLGTALVHFIGTPKIQMANFIERPRMIVPALVSAAISALTVPIFNLKGTAMSAGFGLSGLIGPLGHLGIVGFSAANILIAGIAFIIVPLVISFVMVYIFRNKLHFVKDEDYKLEV